MYSTLLHGEGRTNIFASGSIDEIIPFPQEKIKNYYTVKIKSQFLLGIIG